MQQPRLGRNQALHEREWKELLRHTSEKEGRERKDQRVEEAELEGVRRAASVGEAVA